uniref:Amino acid transporter transmembrane domain-containing protein n=1 Tax=Plectus sambesii TaxID=2011161 RepID=A0A914WP92_9BILA
MDNKMKNKRKLDVENDLELVNVQCSDENGQRKDKEYGLNWWVTGLFIVGECAGGGLVAMPTAIVNTGLLPGLVILAVSGAAMTYTCVQLGWNWTMLQERWPEYRSHCRKPYPAMGFRALGPWCKHLVSLFIDLCQFGICVGFLLLASNNIHNFLKAFFNINVNFCILIIVIAVLILPATLLKSPQDFWPAVVLAMVTTSGACILIVVGSQLDAPTCRHEAYFPSFSLNTFFLGYGTIVFAFGGHAAYPTIQHDMKKPRQFHLSSMLAYTIINVMYVSTAVLGSLTYGDSLRDSVIPSLQIKWMQQTTNVLITLHVCLALTIMFNPINQEVEEVLSLPQTFGWQRVVARSAMMALCAFVAESIPHFGVIFALVGGSTTTMCAIILPGIFNLFLAVAKKKANGSINTDHRATLKEVLTETPPLTLTINLLII